MLVFKAIRSIGCAFRSELGQYDIRSLILQSPIKTLPTGKLARLRASLYRASGLQIGRHTLIAGSLTFGTSEAVRASLRVGTSCFINSHVYIDASAPVILGNGVSIGHHVIIITTDHAIGPPGFRAGALRTSAVTIEDGAWIAAGVTLLPGVTVGRGAVVAAGAVVSRDVPPNTLVGGVPAKLIRRLEG